MKWVKAISRKMFRKYVANKSQNGDNKKTKHAKFSTQKTYCFLITSVLKFAFALLPMNTFDGILDSRALIERFSPIYVKRALV